MTPVGCCRLTKVVAGLKLELTAARAEVQTARAETQEAQAAHASVGLAAARAEVDMKEHQGQLGDAERAVEEWRRRCDAVEAAAVAAEVGSRDEIVGFSSELQELQALFEVRNAAANTLAGVLLWLWAEPALVVCLSQVVQAEGRRAKAQVVELERVNELYRGFAAAEVGAIHMAYESQLSDEDDD